MTDSSAAWGGGIKTVAAGGERWVRNEGFMNNRRLKRVKRCQAFFLYFLWENPRLGRGGNRSSTVPAASVFDDVSPYHPIAPLPSPPRRGKRGRGVGVRGDFSTVAFRPL